MRSSIASWPTMTRRTSNRMASATARGSSLSGTARRSRAGSVGSVWVIGILVFVGRRRDADVRRMSENLVALLESGLRGGRAAGRYHRDRDGAMDRAVRPAVRGARRVGSDPAAAGAVRPRDPRPARAGLRHRFRAVPRRRRALARRRAPSTSRTSSPARTRWPTATCCTRPSGCGCSCRSPSCRSCCGGRSPRR